MKRKISELGLEEIQEVENLNIKSRERIILQKSETILRGDKMKTKNTLLHDFMEIYKNIECDGLTIPCRECKNKKICDTVEDVIKSIGNLYNE